MSTYGELAAWCFMLHHVITYKQEYANSMYILPSFVASASQLYFWAAVYREHSPQVEKAQGFFEYAIVFVQLAQCLIFAKMAAMTLKNVEAPTLPGFVSAES